VPLDRRSQAPTTTRGRVRPAPAPRPAAECGSSSGGSASAAERVPRAGQPTASARPAIEATGRAYGLAENRQPLGLSAWASEEGGHDGEGLLATAAPRPRLAACSTCCLLPAQKMSHAGHSHTINIIIGVYSRLITIPRPKPSRPTCLGGGKGRNVYRQRPAFEIKFRLELQYELVLHVCHVSCVLFEYYGCSTAWLWSRPGEGKQLQADRRVVTAGAATGRFAEAPRAAAPPARDAPRVWGARNSAGAGVTRPGCGCRAGSRGGEMDRAAKRRRHEPRENDASRKRLREVLDGLGGSATDRKVRSPGHARARARAVAAVPTRSGSSVSSVPVPAAFMSVLIHADPC
jgi:hypothetical protein